MIAHRALYGTALGFGLVGIAFRVHPPRLPAAPPAPPILTRPQPRASSSPEVATAYAPIATTNAFSPDRTPPAKRFSPDGRTDTGAPASPRARPRVARPAVHLYGITRSVDGAVALIEADPKIPGAELYRVGERVGGARLAAISDSTVELQGRGGRVVLRLPQPPRR